MGEVRTPFWGRRDAHTDMLRGSLAVATAAVLWGTWRLWFAGPALDSSAQGGLALTVAGVIASTMALRGRRSWPGATRSLWLMLAAFGVAEALNSGLYFRGLADNVATAAVTHYLAPVLIAVASPFVGEARGRRAIPAVAVAFAATVPLVGLSGTASGGHVAALAGAGSAVFYAASVFLSKRITTVLRPWEIVGFHYLIAGPLLLMSSHTPITSASSAELTRTLVGAVIPGTIAAGVYMYGLTRIQPARAGILGYLEPLSAALIGVVFLHQGMTVVQLVAMAIIVLAGVAVVLEPAPDVAAVAR